MALRLAMLGMWHSHADGMAKQIAAHPDEFSLVAGYDPEPEVVASRQRTWGPLLPGLRILDSPAKVLSEELDGVIVDGRVDANVAMARLALESGRSVLLEKPAGDRLTAYRQLLDLADRKHLRVQMIYLFRYMTAVQEMFRRAERGELGHIYSFRARIPKDLGTYARFVDELRPYPGGIFFEMAGHLIDMMVRVIGAPRAVQQVLAHHHSQPPRSYVDNGVALFECERALGIVEVPALEVAPASRRVEVYGTEGAFVIPHLGSGHLANKSVQLAYAYRAGQRDWEELQLPAATLQIADLREFAAVRAGQKEPDFSHAHDLAVQTALLRACNMAEPA